MEDDITVDRIKELALASGPYETLEMVIEGGPVIQQLVLATQLYQHSRQTLHHAANLRLRSEAPEHTEMVQAMVTAAKAASVAFEAAANAAYQLYWAGVHCPCEECVNERRRESAPLN